ncbi:MAG: patatin-like phospholipase family protein [Labilithrix sp.]
MTSRAGRGALVVAGAVAKGAFEAGVTSVLIEEGIDFDRFVGTSAGALNASLLAAGAAVGRLPAAARRLETLWKERGGLGTFLRLRVNLGLGLSSIDGVVELLETEIAAIVAGTKELRATSLTLVTTNLAGVIDPKTSLLTHEDEEVFAAKDFVDPERRRELARVAATSAAFPGLFIPPRMGADRTQHVDGGVVNNAPIAYAIDRDTNANAIVVVSAEPNVPDERGTLRFFPIPTLPSRLVETMINERLSRDLAVAASANDRRAKLITRLAVLAPEVDAEALADEIDLRRLEIVPIRPEAPLGSAFAGFFSPARRARDIAAGRAAAERRLPAVRAAFAEAEAHRSSRPFPVAAPLLA